MEGDTESIDNGRAELHSTHQRIVEWNMMKFRGNSERSMRVRMTLSSPCTPSTLRELGPVSMKFEIPMYNVSGLQVFPVLVSQLLDSLFFISRDLDLVPSNCSLS